MPPGPSSPGTLPIHEQSVEGYQREVKRRIEEKWVYPQEAARRGQSGYGEARFIIRPDGTLKDVEIVRSTGTFVLDRYVTNAVTLASPFPPLPAGMPEEMAITFTFTYVLGGTRAFGFR